MKKLVTEAVVQVVDLVSMESVTWGDEKGRNVQRCALAPSDALYEMAQEARVVCGQLYMVGYMEWMVTGLCVVRCYWSAWRRSMTRLWRRIWRPHLVCLPGVSMSAFRL